MPRCAQYFFDLCEWVSVDATMVSYAILSAWLVGEMEPFYLCGRPAFKHFAFDRVEDSVDKKDQLLTSITDCDMVFRTRS